MKTLLTLGLLLFSQSFFAQNKETIVLDAKYLNSRHCDMVNSYYWTSPPFAANEINQANQKNNGSVSFCIIDSTVLANGNMSYLYAVAENSIQTTYYLSMKFEGEYRSFVLFNMGKNYAADKQSHSAELTDGQFLKQYDGTTLLGITDLFNPEPLQQVNNLSQLLNPATLGQAHFYNMNINSYYQSMDSYQFSSDWLAQYIILPAPVKKKLVIAVKPFDVDAYFNEFSDSHFFSSLLNLPHLANEAKSSPIENTLFRCSGLIITCRVKEIKETLNKELKKA